LKVTIYGPPRIPNARTLSSYGHAGLPVTGVSFQTVSASSHCGLGSPFENLIPKRK
jgi:hypothetical protein